MRRDELIQGTRRLIAEGERLANQPSLGSLQVWLQLSDDLLSQAWGTMDRYHLAWLMVGKPRSVVRGRPMTQDEEAAYVREVAGAKTAALRMSLDAAERQAMPFVGEEGGVGSGEGMGRVPGERVGAEAAEDPGSGPGQGMGRVPGERVGAEAGERPGSGAGQGMGDEPGATTDRGRTHDTGTLPPEADDLARRVADARRRAAEHRDHDAPRAPRPERMER